MEEYGIMSNKISACLYIDKGVLETAKRVGLNVSRVSENALKESIGRPKGADSGTGFNCRPVGMEADGSPG